MKRTIAILTALALVIAAAAAVAEAVAQSPDTQAQQAGVMTARGPRGGQGGGWMPGNYQMPNQAIPNQATPNQATPNQATPNQAAPGQAPGRMPGTNGSFGHGGGRHSRGGRQAMPDLSALVTKGVISQETADSITAYMQQRKSNRFLKELLDAGVINQTEYDALAKEMAPVQPAADQPAADQQAPQQPAPEQPQADATSGATAGANN